MKFIKTKKGISILAVIAVVAISAVGAYAYWSSTGTGAGTGTAGSATPLTVTATVADGLVLDGPGVAASGTVTNPGPNSALVSTISAPVITTNVAGCLPAWFNYSPDAFTPVTLASGGSTNFSGTLTLPDAGPTTNQNPCQGAKYTLTFTAS